MSSKYSPISRLLAAVFALAALLAGASFPGARNAIAGQPGDAPTNRRDAVSGVVRFDPHWYGQFKPRLPFALNAAQGPTVTNVDTTNDPRPQNETTIDINPLNPKIRVAGENDYRTNPSGDVNCGYTYSSDAGLTWTSDYLKGITKGNGGPFDYDAAGDPSVYYGDNGTVYYGCLGFDRGYGRSAIIIDMSTDAGLTWSTPLAVAQSNDPNIFEDKDMITVDNSQTSKYHGRIYVAWTQVGLVGNAIVVSYSSDGGNTWTPTAVVSGTQTRTESPSPAVGPDGTVYVAWCSSIYYCGGGGSAYTFIVKSTDGGATWSQPKAADSFSCIPSPLPGNAFRTNCFPTVTVNPKNGYVALAHSVWNNTDADMTFLFSTNGGSTWSKPKTLQPATDNQFFQWMRVGPTGFVYICYYDQHWNTMHWLDMSCTASKNGVLFAQARRATTESSDPANDGFGGAFIGDYTGMAVDSTGIPHPLWTDTRTGDADAWTVNR